MRSLGDVIGLSVQGCLTVSGCNHTCGRSNLRILEKRQGADTERIKEEVKGPSVGDNEWLALRDVLKTCSSALLNNEKWSGASWAPERKAASARLSDA